ncbi:hypothetical protein [Streptomyces kronopolitis]|uniref:hypothetical protein n=1 Tax=Streptomyces kronopolitis TaxID=1612435 RepID=UPI003445EE6A
MAPAPDGDGLVLVVLEVVTEKYVQVRAWCSPPTANSALQPAGAGIHVHVIAASATV